MSEKKVIGYVVREGKVKGEGRYLESETWEWGTRKNAYVCLAESGFSRSEVRRAADEMRLQSGPCRVVKLVAKDKVGSEMGYTGKNVVGRTAFLRDIHCRPKEVGACKIIARSSRGPEWVVVEWEIEHWYRAQVGEVSVVILSTLDVKR